MSNLSDLVPLGTSGYSGVSGGSGYSGVSGVGTSGYSGYSGSVPTTIDVTVTAGEALSARDCCYIAPVTGGGLTAGRAYKADADTVRQSTQGFWCGFATAAINAAATGTVRVAGVLTGFTITAGAPQYISATAGAITETVLANARIVGIALDTTNLLINTRGANTSITSWATKAYSFTSSGGEMMTVATETFATKNTAVTVGSQCSAVSEGISKAYTAGLNYAATANKLTFSTDTSAAQSTANLSQTSAQTAGLNANNSKGYFMGGITAVGVYSAVSDKITYSTDSTAASTVSNLSQARSGGACNQLTSFDLKGYVLGGGVTAGYVATGDKVTFSNDTTAATTTANLSQARTVGCGLSDGSTKGFYIGGFTSSAPVATSDKITYSNDTTAASTSSNSTMTRSYYGGFSTGPLFGYLTGGYTSAVWATTAATDRVTFSTDTTAARTVANLIAANSWSKGVADVSF